MRCSKVTVVREYMYEGRLYVLVEVTLSDGTSAQAWSCGKDVDSATESAAIAAVRLTRLILTSVYDANNGSGNGNDHGTAEPLKGGEAAGSSIVSSALTDDKLRVLVVDDDRTCLAVLSKALEGFCEVVVGTDGREILDKIVRNEETFDMIFVDERMKHIGGCEALAGMRDFEKSVGRDKIPAVIVSSCGGEDDIRRFREADAQAFLAKPVGTTNLRYEVEELLKLLRRKNGDSTRSGDSIGDMVVL